MSKTPGDRHGRQAGGGGAGRGPGRGAGGGRGPGRGRKPPGAKKKAAGCAGSVVVAGLGAVTVLLTWLAFLGTALH